MQNIGEASLRDAQKGFKKACALHLLDPNVLLIDVGYRILDSQDRRIVDEVAVRIHVRRKIPRGPSFESFKARFPERVPSKKKIGFPIDIPEGPYDLHYWPWYYMPKRNPRTDVHDPLQGGISISNAIKFGCGTLGGKVIDRETEEEMILSNWHVLAGSWIARAGLNIYQPGRRDGGGPVNTIAKLKRHAFNKSIDAAVAELTGNRQCINDQMKLGEVKGVKQPELGMKVIKSGRRTGVTSGIITGIGGYSKFCYDGLMRTVRHVIHIAPARSGAEVSAPGDSGSWWLDAESHCAVALHFAGSNNPEYGLAINMPQVLEALKVDIAYK